MNMIKLAALSAAIMSLTACGTPSVEAFIDDPEMLAETLQECQMDRMQGKDTDEEKCQNAQQAAMTMGNNLFKSLIGG